MSSAHFIGIRCDGCKQPFQLAEQANDRAFFADEARKVRKHARAAGWRCRAWEITTGRMIDACPKCIPSLNWGRKIDLLGRTSKPKGLTLLLHRVQTYPTNQRTDEDAARGRRG